MEWFEANVMYVVGGAFGLFAAYLIYRRLSRKKGTGGRSGGDGPKQQH